MSDVVVVEDAEVEQPDLRRPQPSHLANHVGCDNMSQVLLVVDAGVSQKPDFFLHSIISYQRSRV